MQTIDQSGRISLPAPIMEGKVSFEAALRQRRSVREFSAAALSLEDLSQLLWVAQGRTGSGRRRTAPSAGATFPLETRAVVGNVAEVPPGIYLYDCATHSLKLETPGDLRTELSAVSLGQTSVAQGAFTLALSAVRERTAARYNERAVRYVDMEAGHAGQNIYLEAAVRGLATVAVGAFDDDAVARVLALPPSEVPLYLFPIGYPR